MYISRGEEMKSLVLLLSGVVIGSFLTMLLAQRAAYFTAAEQLARISSDFERTAKKLAAEGKQKDAERELVAAIGLRNAIAKIDEHDIIPPIGAPGSMMLEVLLHPREPSIKISDIYSDRATTFMYECALIELSFPRDQEGAKVAERNSLVAHYPKSNPANCAAIGAVFWTK
jgi:hypothetical protein